MVQALWSSSQCLLRRILSPLAFRSCLLTSKAQLIRPGLWACVLIQTPMILSIIPFAFDAHGPFLDLSVPEPALGHRRTLGLSLGQQCGMYRCWLVSPQVHLLIICLSHYCPGNLLQPGTVSCILLLTNYLKT